MPDVVTPASDGTEASRADGGDCSCGSGLRHARCCGLDQARIAPAPAEGAYDPTLEAMGHAYAHEDRATARRLAREVLETEPGQRDALATLFNLLRDEGKPEAAGIIAERLTRVEPNNGMARAVAAQHFLARRELGKASLHARMLVRLAPLDVTAHAIMARVFLATNNAVAAEHHVRVAMRLAIERDPGAPLPHLQAQLATALHKQGRLAEARALFARLAARHGDSLDMLLPWTALEESARDFDAAMALLDRAERIAPGHSNIAVARAALHRRRKEPEAALAVLAGLHEAESGGEEVLHGLLHKGQVLDSVGRYDEAFAAFEDYKAQTRARTGHAYRAEEAARLVGALRDFFTASRDSLLPRAETRSDVPQPIFIIGFPRSGTTLVEQTLTSHPQIAAGDELPIVGTLVDRARTLLGSPANYPEALSELWLGDRQGHINTLRDVYLAEAARIGAADPAKPWFTDKMPLNETHLGLISLMFPRSPVIHLVRHPLDVVLSVFSNGLTHGFYCAYALESAATHYALIADLIAHYRAAMPIRYHAVRYEELVTDQEREVRAMLDFIGLPFDPRTLDFHANPRPARTASHAQVTERLYDRSRYRYRNYLRHLEPVVPILTPAIERLGYRIER